MTRSLLLSFSLTMLFVPLSGVFAMMSDERDTTKPTNRTTEHPPHDHQHHDHIKKLDEGMQRRKKKLA